MFNTIKNWHQIVYSIHKPIHMPTAATHPMVPVQEVGKALDLHYSVNAADRMEAKEIFLQASARLSDPSGWQQLTGAAGPVFKRIGKDELQPTGALQKNDFIRIDIPGPGTAAGKGYDYVQVEKLEMQVDVTAEESVGLQLRACSNPFDKEQETAHFFTAAATSTFIISRKGNTITAYYYGRNEIPNATDVGLTDKIRNTVVAAGAKAGGSEWQWTAFIKGLLQSQA